MKIFLSTAVAVLALISFSNFVHADSKRVEFYMENTSEFLKDLIDDYRLIILQGSEESMISLSGLSDGLSTPRLRDRSSTDHSGDEICLHSATPKVRQYFGYLETVLSPEVIRTYFLQNETFQMTDGIEEQLIYTIYSFNNYLRVSNELVEIYRPFSSEDFSDYSARIKSGRFKNKMEDLKTRFKIDRDFTIFKPQAIAQFFSVGPKRYEDSVRGVLQGPMRSIVNAYDFAKSVDDSPTWHGFFDVISRADKCDLEKMEKFQKWWTKAQDKQVRNTLEIGSPGKSDAGSSQGPIPVNNQYLDTISDYLMNWVGVIQTSLTSKEAAKLSKKDFDGLVSFYVEKIVDELDKGNSSFKEKKILYFDSEKSAATYFSKKSKPRAAYDDKYWTVLKADIRQAVKDIFGAEEESSGTSPTKAKLEPMTPEKPKNPEKSLKHGPQPMSPERPDKGKQAVSPARQRIYFSSDSESD